MLFCKGAVSIQTLSCGESELVTGWSAKRDTIVWRVRAGYGVVSIQAL